MKIYLFRGMHIHVLMKKVTAAVIMLLFFLSQIAFGSNAPAYPAQFTLRGGVLVGTDPYHQNMIDYFSDEKSQYIASIAALPAPSPGGGGYNGGNQDILINQSGGVTLNLESKNKEFTLRPNGHPGGNRLVILVTFVPMMLIYINRSTPFTYAPNQAMTITNGWKYHKEYGCVYSSPSVELHSVGIFPSLPLFSSLLHQGAGASQTISLTLMDVKPCSGVRKGYLYIQPIVAGYRISYPDGPLTSGSYTLPLSGVCLNYPKATFTIGGDQNNMQSCFTSNVTIKVASYVYFGDDSDKRAFDSLSLPDDGSEVTSDTRRITYQTNDGSKKFGILVTCSNYEAGKCYLVRNKPVVDKRQYQVQYQVGVGAWNIAKIASSVIDRANINTINTHALAGTKYDDLSIRVHIPEDKLFKGQPKDVYSGQFTLYAVTNF